MHRMPQHDVIILLSRILLMLLMVVFGWQKLMHFSGTIEYMQVKELPMPTLAALLSVVMELGVGLALAVGLFTRSLALLMVFYVLGTALIGHAYWAMEGPERIANMINFYKNMSIMGGLLLLYITGSGRFSIDAARRRD